MCYAIRARGAGERSPSGSLRMADRDIEQIADRCAARRILVTGSRVWEDRDSIARTLSAAHAELGVPPGQIVVVHGAQGTLKGGVVVKGLDLMAAEVAAELGMGTEAHPANWQAPCVQICDHGPRPVNRLGRSYCPAAGFRRNQRMVLLGACLCLAWPLGRSAGTRDCMRRAERAGILVRNLGDPDPVGQPDLFGAAS